MVVLSRVSGDMSLRIVSACNVKSIRTEVSKCSLRIFLEAVEHGACERIAGRSWGWGRRHVLVKPHVMAHWCRYAELPCRHQTKLGVAAVAIAVRRGQTSSANRRASLNLE